MKHRRMLLRPALGDIHPPIIFESRSITWAQLFTGINENTSKRPDDTAALSVIWLFHWPEDSTMGLGGRICRDATWLWKLYEPDPGVELPCQDCGSPWLLPLCRMYCTHAQITMSRVHAHMRTLNSFCFVFRPRRCVRNAASAVVCEWIITKATRPGSNAAVRIRRKSSTGSLQQQHF
jgi:hypothetical protein